MNHTACLSLLKLSKNMVKLLALFLIYEELTLEIKHPFHVIMLHLFSILPHFTPTSHRGRKHNTYTSSYSQPQTTHVHTEVSIMNKQNKLSRSSGRCQTDGGRYRNKCTYFYRSSINKYCCMLYIFIINCCKFLS